MLQCCCKWTQLLSLNRFNNDLGTRTFPTALNLVLADNGSKGEIACTTYPAYFLQRLRPSPRLSNLFKLQPSGFRMVWCVAGWDSFVHVESLEYIQCAAEPGLEIANIIVGLTASTMKGDRRLIMYRYKPRGTLRQSLRTSALSSQLSFATHLEHLPRCTVSSFELQTLTASILGQRECTEDLSLVLRGMRKTC